MSEPCEEIQRDTKLGLEVGEGFPRRAHVVFGNHTSAPLWFPEESEPGYHFDKESGTVTVSFGFFEELYGRYRAQYMIPPMRAVAPGREYRLEIKDRDLVARLSEADVRARLQARVALKAIEHSNVRGGQDLDSYLRESCVVTYPRPGAQGAR
jgi:hypothetical protein